MITKSACTTARAATPAWSAPLTLHVETPAGSPSVLFNVRDYGADGLASHDNTVAIQAALDAAKAAGGGIVLLPRGRYSISGTLNIPRMTTLRGASEDTVCLFWPDTPAPLDALIRGTNHFGVEDLTIYATNHKGILVGDTGDQPDSGHVPFLARADSRRCFSDASDGRAG